MNSETLKQLRYHYDLTQKQMGKILGLTDIDICRWEREKRQLSDKRLRSFIEKLKEELGDG